MGVPESEARLWLGQAASDEAVGEFLLWPGNAEAMSFFVALDRCWVGPPMGGLPLRIERGEMLATATLMGIRRVRWPGLFGKIQAMEQEALATWKTR